MDEIYETAGNCDAQNSNETEIAMEMEIEPEIDWKNMVDEEISIFETLTAAQIEKKMNRCIDEAIEYIEPIVSVSWIAFLPFYL